MADTDPEGFVIEGESYEFPTLDSLTLNEAELLHDRAGVGIEDFVVVPELSNIADVAAALMRPKNLRAFATISYLRRHDVDADEGWAKAGNIQAVGALVALLSRGGDADPPEVTSEHNGSSQRSSLDSSKSSGPDSTSTPEDVSSATDDEPATTGTSESATSFQPSLEKTSATNFAQPIC